MFTDTEDSKQQLKSVRMPPESHWTLILISLISETLTAYKPYIRTKRYAPHMKNHIFILAAGLGLCNFACKSTQESGTEQTQHYTQTAPTDSPGNPDWVVSYYSVAYGIDLENLQALESYIENFRSEHGITLEIVRKSRGREGETDLCILTISTSENLKKKLEEGIKSVIINGKNVRFLKDVPCRD